MTVVCRIVDINDAVKGDIKCNAGPGTGLSRGELTTGGGLAPAVGVRSQEPGDTIHLLTPVSLPDQRFQAKLKNWAFIVLSIVRATFALGLVRLF